MNFLRDWAQATEEEPSAPAPAAAGSKQHPVTLLVIQSDNYDWRTIFNCSCLVDGRHIHVEQVGWEDIMVSADSPAMSKHTPILVHVRPSAKEKDGVQRKKAMIIRPDFCLVRNEVRGATHLEDYRNALFGLMFAGIPSVNSLYSIYNFLERPIVQAELNKIQRKLGVDRFPLIPQSYFASHSTMMYGNKFPAVLKVGHAHAGFGKMRVDNHHDWEDVRSVVAMTDGKYCTAEPFITGDFDLRIQKIVADNTEKEENHYRAYRRDNISGTWKTNTGCSILSEVDLTPEYKLWVDESSKMFGGLDICTVDVIHEHETGKEYILEVNGTSSGLCPEFASIDNEHICELVMKRMNDYFCKEEANKVEAS